MVDALSQPSASHVAAATDALGAMVAGWEADGWSGDVLPLDSRFEEGLVAMLAVRLAEEYGKAPGPILMRDATIGEQRLQAHFFVVPASTFETSLGVTTAGLPIRFLRRPPIRAWEASTEYLPRQKRIKDQNIYEVVTGGTSGTTGPSGSGSTITDGTVVWCWRGVTE